MLEADKAETAVRPESPTFGTPSLQGLWMPQMSVAGPVWGHQWISLLENEAKKRDFRSKRKQDLYAIDRTWGTNGQFLP